MDDMLLYALHGVFDGPDYSVTQNADGSYNHQWKFQPLGIVTSNYTTPYPWIWREWQRQRVRNAHRRARLSTQRHRRTSVKTSQK